MTLKDYVNYRGRGKGKTTSYQQRTQRFYDGKRIVIDSVAYPGIPANFMNTLQIPNSFEIAKVQKEHFIAIHKTQAQKATLTKLQSLNASGFQQANQLLDVWIFDLIKRLEQGVGKILEEGKTKNIMSSGTPNYTALNVAYNDFKKIYKEIKNQAPVQSIDNYFIKLEEYMKLVDAQLLSNPSALLDKTIINKAGKETSFVNLLMNLSYQIKGVSLLEHSAIEFIKKYVKLPDDIEIVGSGQILVGGKQASQDALFLDKNLKIKLDSGEVINFLDYVNNNQNNSTTINLSFSEWEQLFQFGAIGLQSKYSQYGNIKMANISMKEILTTDLQQTKALRMLYILNNQIDIDGKVLITHKFNIKKTGKAQEDYKRLFSYGLCKYMDNILKHNHYMVTAKNQIIDSNTYYRTLFNKGRYFRPGGDISLAKGNLNKDYRISIKET